MRGQHLATERAINIKSRAGVDECSSKLDTWGVYGSVKAAPSAVAAETPELIAGKSGQKPVTSYVRKLGRKLAVAESSDTGILTSN